MVKMIKKNIKQGKKDQIKTRGRGNLSEDKKTIPVPKLHFDSYLDCKNMLCPRPIFEISKKIRSMTNAEVLMVECRDAAFKSDIEVWTKRMNCGLTLFEQDKTFTAYIKKN